MPTPAPDTFDDEYDDKPRKPRSPFATVLLAALILGFFVVFVSLGTWQVQRRAWKLDLIERVDARIHAPATDGPPIEDWQAISRDRDEYRVVRLRGKLHYDKEALVQASSVLGAGHWVLTPLETAQHGIVFINRGFVPPDRRAPEKRRDAAPEGLVDVIGLMRMPEPGGAFLRSNDPAADRWYSRDTQALAQSRGLEAARTAPYFVDLITTPVALTGADAPATDSPSWNPPPAQGDEIAIHHWLGTQRVSWPMPGLTVVSFANNHTVYALTWYGLALLAAAGGWLLYRDWRSRREALS
ncbi:MAG: SURF1 family protein [Lautropia sp.]|nr:SURF1 family protein [Lautropia sp.]